jgi:hypothetical protein
MQCARAIDWRGTAVLVSVEGPSTRACYLVSTWASFFARLVKGTYALVVDDFYNGSKLSVLRAAVDEDNASNLDQSPRGCGDFGVTHCEEFLIPSSQ